MERPRIQPRITLSGQVRSARLRSEQPSNLPGGTNKIRRMLGNLKRLRMCAVTLVLLSRCWCARRTLMTEWMGGQRPGSSRTLGVTSLEGGTLVTFLISYKTPERSRLRAEGLFGSWFCRYQGRASKVGEELGEALLALLSSLWVCFQHISKNHLSLGRSGNREHKLEPEVDITLKTHYHDTLFLLRPQLGRFNSLLKTVPSGGDQMCKHPSL